MSSIAYAVMVTILRFSEVGPINKFVLASKGQLCLLLIQVHSSINNSRATTSALPLCALSRNIMSPKAWLGAPLASLSVLKTSHNIVH